MDDQADATRYLLSSAWGKAFDALAKQTLRTAREMEPTLVGDFEMDDLLTTRPFLSPAFNEVIESTLVVLDESVRALTAPHEKRTDESL